MHFKIWKQAGCGLLLVLTGLFAFPQTEAQESHPREFMNLLDQARRLSVENKWAEAVPSWSKITELNPVNGEFWAQLGHACYQFKDYDRSIEAYTRVIDLGYGLVGNAAYNIACCFALKGNKEKALEWLERALNTGFNHIEHALTDADLQLVRDEPRFRRLTGSTDVSKMNRTEGWRHDLQLLKQEVLRKVYYRRELSLDAFNRQYETLFRSVGEKTDIQIMLDLMKMMASIRDGHTGLFPPSRREFQLTLPLQFYLFREGLYIVATAPAYKHLLGQQVTGFGKKSVAQVSEALSPLISRDNEMGVLQNLPVLMRYTHALHGLGLIPHPDKAELQLLDTNGKRSRVVVPADTSLPRVDHKSVPAHWVTLHQSLSYPVPLYLKNLKSLYWFERLPESRTVYFQWNSVRNDRSVPLNHFADSLMGFMDTTDVERLVIDLRWNNGGNTMLVPYFIHALIRNEKINKRGRLFVITGRRTFSAAQNLASFMEQQTQAIFIGEPTGSSPNFVGEEDFILLPYSKVALNVSDLYWQSSWPWDKRSWIAPLLFIPPTFEAYRKNKDEALDAVLSLEPGRSF